ncbi:MAG TPA: hypothetical protein DEA63_02045 [Firmicutes bacterium]|nr:hypothetical protein [Bacillota bacterium]
MILGLKANQPLFGGAFSSLSRSSPPSQAERSGRLCARLDRKTKKGRKARVGERALALGILFSTRFRTHFKDFFHQSGF